jgi:hypothetical protein
LANEGKTKKRKAESLKIVEAAEGQTQSKILAIDRPTTSSAKSLRDPNEAVLALVDLVKQNQMDISDQMKKLAQTPIFPNNYGH